MFSFFNEIDISSTDEIFYRRVLLEKCVTNKTVKIVILKSSSKFYWYTNYIGHVFLVKIDNINGFSLYRPNLEPLFYVKREDCEVLN